MADVKQAPQQPDDCSRAALDLAHCWLRRPGTAPSSLPKLLGELATTFRAGGAGLASLADGKPVLRERVGPECGTALPLPWAGNADLLARLRRSSSALVINAPGKLSLLCAAIRAGDGSAWLLWLERPAGAWHEAEAAAVAVAAQVLARRLEDPERVPGWVRQLEHAARQQSLEDAAAWTCKLAHDYGNVLTSVFGFAELSMSLLPAGSPARRYLEEVHSGAQEGAVLTQRLRLFARRPPPSPASTPLAAAASGARKRAEGWAAGVELRVEIPADLPPVAMSAELLHEVIGALLDNAHEAAEPEGTVTLSARLARLEAEEAVGLWGDAGPGEYVCLEVADTGPGLAPEARQRLLREPFYSSKLRHRGLGLSGVYGLLHSHKGGFSLDAAPSGGVAARVYLPPAAVAAPADVSSPRRFPADGLPAAVR